MGKAITPQNYIGHYISWCLRNSFSPLSFEVLQEIFIGCETNEDFALTLDALYTIQLEGLKLSFMSQKQKDHIQVLTVRLKLRLELFKRVPSATNMLLAYNMIEELTLKVFSENSVNMDDKQIERFDKLKNLACGTKFINERKVAFDRSIEVFTKLTKIEV